MFDILDSNMDLSTLGGLSNTRSNSMKKITKKDSKTSGFLEQSTISQNKKYNGDLLDVMIGSESKNYQSIDRNHLTNSTNRHKTQGVDVHFDLSSHSREISVKSNTLGGNERSSLNNEHSQNDIQAEDQGINLNFGKTQHTILNPSKITDSFVSHRNMKPPMKKKQVQINSQSFNFVGSSMGIAIPEQDPFMTNSSEGYDDKRINNRSFRRSSIDRSEMNDDVPSLGDNNFHHSVAHSFNFDTVKEENQSGIAQSRSCYLQQQKNQIKSSDSNNFFMAKDKLQNKSQNIKITEDVCHKRSADQRYRHHQKIVQNKNLLIEYEKQIQILKNSYQNQITHLQKCLDKQIAENKSMRESFLTEVNCLIDQQRSRTTKIHEEEICRLKDMFGWQKKKLEDTYKMEINSLRSSLDFAHRSSQMNRENPHNSKQNLQFLQYQLKSKEQMISNKLKNIQMREMELQTKQMQLNTRRKKQENRIRDQQKRLMEMQLQFKKQMMENKKEIFQQKQALASELGALQGDYLSKKEKIELQQKELQLDRNALQEEKRQMKRINGEFALKHRESLEELYRQKQKIKDLQIQLVKKIRVVELRAKELSYHSNNQEDISYHKKQSNWIVQHQNLARNREAESIEKKLNNAKSMNSIMKTKDRFHQLQKNSRSKLNLTTKQNKKIDLSGYIVRMQNYTRYNWPI